MLSETTLATLLGAAIGAIPSIIVVIIESRNQRCKERHELALKRMELVEKDKIAAIKDFNSELGALSRIKGSSSPDLSPLLRALLNAGPFVSEKTLGDMFDSVHSALSALDINPDDFSSLYDEVLLKSLHSELYSSLDNPRRQRKSGGEKRAKRCLNRRVKAK